MQTSSLQTSNRESFAKMSRLDVCTELDTDWIHPWIGLDWIGSTCGRNCMDWTGLGQMTANCLESEIFRDSKLDWSNKL